MTELESEQKIKEMFEALAIIEEQIHDKEMELNALRQRKALINNQLHFMVLRFENALNVKDSM